MLNQEKNLLLIAALQQLKEFERQLMNDIWQTDTASTPTALQRYQTLVQKHTSVKNAIKLLDD